jgi:hypothetical protein
MQPTQFSRKIQALLLLALFVLLTLFIAARAVHAGTLRQADATPTIENDTEGTPAWLLTPFPTLAESNTPPARPGALFATALLFFCGMVGMLIAGVGIAMLMVRLRTRSRH